MINYPKSAVFRKNPEDEVTSPALANMPPSITGQHDPANTKQMPRTESGSQPNAEPALTTAPSPDSTMPVDGKPLSNDGALGTRDGAVVDLDLMKDRGTPGEFWTNMIKDMGSQMGLDLVDQAREGSSMRTGQLGQMDPETARRMGARMNESLGISSPEQQNKVLDDLVFKPTAATLMAENKQGVIDDITMIERAAQTRAKIEGIENEEHAREVFNTAITDVAADDVGDDVKEGAWKRFKNWFWNAGKDDPNTPEDESKETYWVDKYGNEVEEGTKGAIEKQRDVQVTGFMGGMTRQELGMFVFQWGSLMMANSGLGFGEAMGQAGMGALQGHLGRREAARTGALEEREIRQKDRELDLTETALEQERFKDIASVLQYGFTDKDGWWRVPRHNPETGQWEWVIATDSAGKQVKGEEFDDQYAGEQTYLMKVAEDLGRDPDDVLKAKLGEMTSLNIQDFWLREIKDDKARYIAARNSADPTGALASAGFVPDQTVTWETSTGEEKTKKLEEMSPDDMSEYSQYAAARTEARRREWEQAQKDREAVERAANSALP